MQFNQTGDKFVLVIDGKISIQESEDAKLIFELDNKKRFFSAGPGNVLFYPLLDLFTRKVHIFIK